MRHAALGGEQRAHINRGAGTATERRAPVQTTETAAGSPAGPKLSMATGCGLAVAPEFSTATGDTKALAQYVHTAICIRGRRNARAAPARGGGAMTAAAGARGEAEPSQLNTGGA